MNKREVFVVQKNILVLNSGSSSLKFSIYEVNSGRIGRRGQVDYDLSGVASSGWYVIGDASAEKIAFPGVSGLSREESTHLVLRRSFPGIVGVGHRVVHGRDRGEHARVTDDLLIELEGNIPLAPLHQPNNLEPIRILREAYPNVPQVACFDTAFHRTRPSTCSYALPVALMKVHGIKGYGFHGLSYEFVSQSKLLSGKEKVVVCHLGNGASLCWMRFNQNARKYESLGCSLGYSTMDGLPMGTRVGPLDPGVVLDMVSNARLWGIVREGESDVDAVRRILLKESGLLGMSGISGDMRVLLDVVAHREQSDTVSRKAAGRAIRTFVDRVACAISAAVVRLCGLDMIVFTGGIGENAQKIRRYVCEKLSASILPSLRLDEALNERYVGGEAGRISHRESGVLVSVIPTDENRVIFEATRRIIEDAGESRLTA